MREAGERERASAREGSVVFSPVYVSLLCRAATALRDPPLLAGRTG